MPVHDDRCVDKIWYNWQNRDVVDAKSFYGGSVEHLANLDNYNQYPTDGLPYLNVNTCQFRLRIRFDYDFPAISKDTGLEVDILISRYEADMKRARSSGESGIPLFVFRFNRRNYWKGLTPKSPAAVKGWEVVCKRHDHVVTQD